MLITKSSVLKLLSSKCALSGVLFNGSNIPGMSVWIVPLPFKAGETYRSGFTMSFSFDGDESYTLSTAKGSPRVFTTLDAAFKVANDIGLEYVTVSMVC